MGMILVVVCGMAMLAWLAWAFCKPARKKKSAEEEADTEEEPIDRDEANDIMGNLVNDLVAENKTLRNQIRELERKISFMMAIIQKNDKTEHGELPYFDKPCEVFTTPTGSTKRQPKILFPQCQVLPTLCM